MNYTDDTVQAYVSPWWITDNKRDFRRGRLIKAFLPHVHQIPFTLIPTGRSEDPTDHSKIRYTMKELKLLDKNDRSLLPASALVVPEGENILAFRGKKRPALIISSGGDEIPENLRKGKPAWQTAPTILVVPYYGVAQDGKRAGFSEPFVDWVKKAEYPNFYWDRLPITGEGQKGSICRLDHILPLGRHHDSVEFTEHCLSEEAMEIMSQWLRWLIEEILPDGDLLYLREELLKIQEI